jgi:hypothetical protein
MVPEDTVVLLVRRPEPADRGRFFANEQNLYRAWQLPAFRGFLHEVLDHVLGVVRELMSLVPQSDY